jgi:Uma2 family endonuclease
MQPTQRAQIVEGDQVVQIAAPWALFERFLKSRRDMSTPRLTYDRGVLQFMAPSESHESVSRLLTVLLHTWALERDVELRAVGSWTLKRKAAQTAIEPDECFVVGRHQPRVPDLAIEVVWTNPGLDKLPLYARLGVREVWFWQAGSIQVFVRRGRSHSRASRSAVLPGIDLALIAELSTMRSHTQAARLLRQRLGAN